MREADYEIASYAYQHDSMGILGQDSDFIIYDRFVKVITLLHLDFQSAFLWLQNDRCNLNTVLNFTLINVEDDDK